MYEHDITPSSLNHVGYTNLYATHNVKPSTLDSDQDQYRNMYDGQGSPTSLGLIDMHSDGKQSGGESVDEQNSRPASPTSGMYDTGVYVCMSSGMYETGVYVCMCCVFVCVYAKWW
jgi:hypothetical protein